MYTESLQDRTTHHSKPGFFSNLITSIRSNFLASSRKNLKPSLTLLNTIVRLLGPSLKPSHRRLKRYTAIIGWRDPGWMYTESSQAIRASTTDRSRRGPPAGSESSQAIGASTTDRSRRGTLAEDPTFFISRSSAEDGRQGDGVAGKDRNEIMQSADEISSKLSEARCHLYRFRLS